MTDQVSPADERIFAFRQLPTGPTAPGEAREWSLKVLTCWDLTSVADDLQTVVTELVTNSLRAGADAIHALIQWQWSADTVELQVWDDAPGQPQLRQPDFVAETGRGLFPWPRCPPPGDITPASTAARSYGPASQRRLGGDHEGSCRLGALRRTELAARRRW